MVSVHVIFVGLGPIVQSQRIRILHVFLVRSSLWVTLLALLVLLLTIRGKPYLQIYELIFKAQTLIASLNGELSLQVLSRS